MKSKLNYKSLAFVFGIVVVISWSFLSSSFGGTRTLPIVKAVDNPCLKFLPRDAWIIGNVDVKALIDFMRSAGEENPAMDMVIEQYAEMFKGFTGIDILKEVRYLTFCLTGNHESDIQGLIVIKGSFNSSVSEMRLSLGIGSELQKKSYNRKTLYEDQDMGYTFLEFSTLVVGSPSLLRKAIDVLDTGSLPMSSYYQRTLEKTNGESIAWIALKPEILLESDEVAAQRRRNPDLFAKMSILQCASFFSEPVPDGLLITALGCVTDRQRAQELYSFLTNTKTNALDVNGANVFLGSFLVLSDITMDGEFVRWDLQLTLRALEKLWKTEFVRKVRSRAI